MGTDTLQKPDSEEDKPRFSDESPQSDIDREFDKILKDNYSPEELEEKENDSDNDDSDENQEKDDLEEGGFYTGGANGSSKKKNGRRGLVVGGGIGALILSAVFAIMAFLPAFVATHVVESIENQIGQVPQYAIEKRTQYYMNKYLMLKTLGVTSEAFDGNDSRFVYLSRSPLKTLYVNWEGAKIENNLKSNYNMEIKSRSGGVSSITRNTLKADNWTFSYNGGDPQPLTAKEARQSIREFAKKETKSGQVFKRARLRYVAKRFYGVPNWKPFEKTRQSYAEKKIAFKQKAVRNTIGYVSEKTSDYIGCLIEGGDDCKKIKEGDTAEKDRKSDSNPDDDKNDSGASEDQKDKLKALDGDEAADAVADLGDGAADDAAELIAKETGQETSQRILSLSTKKILTGGIAAIGLIDTISQVVKSVNDGSINIVINDKLTSQYIGYATFILSAADQIRSGEDFDQADVRILNETFKNFQSSPVSQSAAGKIDTTKSVSRDCNGDNDTNDPGEKLEPGQVVCKEKRVLQDKTAFTNNPAWEGLAKVSDAYENSPVNSVIDLTDKLSSAITSSLGIDELIGGAMESLGISRVFMSSFESLLNRVIGFSITGTEEGADAYDATYAGMDSLSASTGGGIGTRTDEDKTIGGGYLNEQQIVAIQNDMQEQRGYELRNMNMFARYFSPDVPESLTSQAVLSSPTDLTTMAEKMSSVFSSSSLTSGISNIFSKKVSAYDRNVNPFGVLNFGLPADHPVFTDNNGDGMDPDVLRERYQCDLPADEREQNKTDNADSYGKPVLGNDFDFGEGNKMPFNVPLQPDPCLLELAVEEAGSMLFDGTYDDDIDGNSSSNSSATEDTLLSSTIVSGDTSNIPCQAGKDLGVKDGYKEGNLIKIRVCDVQGIDTNSQISGNLDKLLNDARAAGINFTGGGYRTMDEQKSLYASHNCPAVCSPPTARPGFSNHQMGLAIDFAQNGSTLRKNNSGFSWLGSNASKYGLKNFPKESWHWSVDGK